MIQIVIFLRNQPKSNLMAIGIIGVILIGYANLQAGLEFSASIFYLPQGETWPSQEYLVQANRRIIFFVDGNYTGESRILHQINNYAFEKP